MEGANLGFSVFDDAPSWIVFPRAGCVECVFHYFGLVWFGVVEGKNFVEGLSETMKAVGMRGSGKEGKD